MKTRRNHIILLALSLATAQTKTLAFESPALQLGRVNIWVQFDVDSTLVHAEDDAKVRYHAKELAEFPEFTINVEGHADSAEQNGELLSAERAIAVALILQDSGVEATNIQVCARGTTWPATHYDSYYLHRRVEITIDQQQSNRRTGSCRGKNVRWLAIPFG